MVKRISVILTIVLFVFASLHASNVDQAGAAASGRSASGIYRLESVLGQSVSGTAGRLTSGFLSEQVIPRFLPGDVDGDGIISISDAVFLINYIFAGGEAPPNAQAADADCNGILTISDAVFLVNYIFSGGPGPHMCS